MTSDENMMAEMIGRLTEEKANLLNRVRELERNMRHDGRAHFAWKIARTFFWAAILAPVCWQGVSAVFRAMTAPTVASHCYVAQPERAPVDEEKGRPFNLMGYVRYGSDIVHGSFPRLQDAVWAAKELGCPLRPEGLQ